MLEMKNEISVDRPAEAVWTLVGNPGQWHTWRGAMTGPAVKLGEGPMEVGTVYDYHSEFLGRSVEGQLKVVNFEPGARLTMATDRPIPIRLAFRIEPVGDSTRVIQETRGEEVAGLFGMAEPLIKPLMKRRFQQDLETLKELAETESH